MGEDGEVGRGREVGRREGGGGGEGERVRTNASTSASRNINQDVVNCCLCTMYIVCINK